MTLPVPTTTITVRRPTHDPAADAFDPDTGPATVVVEGHPAHFSSPTFAAGGSGSQPPPSTKETLRTRLLADPMDLRQIDEVEDDSTGEVWEVTWARAVNDLEDRPDPENDSHVLAEVLLVRGVG